MERGLAAGTGIGKALEGLGGAIGGAIQQSKQDAVANQLMNAAPTATANAQALQDPDPDPLLTGEDNLNPTAATDPSGTQDPTPYTGGLDELKLRQAAAKEALSSQNVQSEIAQRQAATSLAGTKSEAATNLANLRAGIAANQPAGGAQPQTGNPSAWSGYQVAGAQPTTKTGRPPSAKQVAQAPVVIGSEPVTDQSQLVTHFDGTYGKGSFSKVMSNLDSAVPSADGTKITVGPPGKEITVPMADAQAYTKQANALRIKQNLAPFPVPGEDPTLGASQANPYPAKHNLDVYSRPHGSWVTLPNGKTAQVP